MFDANARTRYIFIITVKCAMWFGGINFFFFYVCHGDSTYLNLSWKSTERLRRWNSSVAHFLLISIAFDDFVRIFVRHPCHHFDRSTAERNRLSINTGELQPPSTNSGATFDNFNPPHPFTFWRGAGEILGWKRSEPPSAPVAFLEHEGIPSTKPNYALAVCVELNRKPSANYTGP